MKLVTKERPVVKLLQKDDVEVKPIKQQPERRQTELDYSKFSLYFRPATLNDLDLLSSWDQNSIIKKHLIENKWGVWDEVINVWHGEKKNIIAIVVLVEPYNPLSFYCGRSIGYVEWSDWEGEFVDVKLAICDPGLWGKGLGKKLFDMAIQYECDARGSGKVCINVHKDNTAMMKIIKHYNDMGLVVSTGELQNDFVNVQLRVINKKVVKS